MPKLLRVGIVGCGAIGTSLAKAVVKDFKKTARLNALFDIQPEKSTRLARLVSKKISVKNIKRLIGDSDLVIEAASAKSSAAIAEAALRAGRDVMVMSVGGVIAHRKRLSKIAAANAAKIYLPSGAIAGIDGLKAAALGNLGKVTLTTRKNPASFRGVRFIESRKIRLEGLKKEKVLFSGKASQAVKYFPQNINVAATLSLVGLGADKTRVRIIASPAIKRNIHEIEIDSRAARISTVTENVLHPDNPKTSFLAVLAAIATLKQIIEPIKIGT